MKIANERREKPRINLKGAAFVFDRRGRQQVALVNLSAVGILVEMPKAPSVREAVKLGLCLDGKSWLELDGVVRRVDRHHGIYACAIDLRRSTVEKRTVIDDYVARVLAALNVAKQRDMFAKRVSGAAGQQPAATRDELIRQALPTAVLPPAPGEERARPPLLPLLRKETAKKPAEPAKRVTPKPERRKADPKLRSLYAAAVHDLEGDKR